MDDKIGVLNASVSGAFCSLCNKPPRSKAYLYLCHSCNKYYDKTCGKFVITTLEDNSAVKVCSECSLRPKQAAKPTANNNSLRRSYSLLHTHSVAASTSVSGDHTHKGLGHTPAKNTTHDDNSAAYNQETSLREFMEEMRRMNGNLGEKISNLDTKFGSRLDNFSTQLAVLDSIPSLVKRVDEAEADIELVKQQLLDLRQQLTRALDSGSSSSLPDDISQRINNLEKQNAELVTKLQKLKADTNKKANSNEPIHNTRDNSSSPLGTEVVISGLAVKKGTSFQLKELVTAALKAVYPDLEKRDVISARYLIRRSTVSLPKPKQSDFLPDGGSTEAGSTTANDGDQQGSLVNSGTASGRKTTSSSSPSIAVALSSRPLMLEVLRLKARLGKLHTTACEPNLPAGFEPSSIIPGLINIHEFLPGPIFQLHSTVRFKAKQLRDNSKPGFIHFISRGQIYVRRSKGEPSIMISSMKDLDDFLAS